METKNYKDKYGKKLVVGDVVVFASANSKKQPYLNEGIIVSFISSPSFDYAIIKTKKNRVTKKDLCDIVKLK